MNIDKDIEEDIKKEDKIKNIIARAKEINDKSKGSNSEPSLEGCLAIDILNLGKELEIKDKMIDLMTDFIDDLNNNGEYDIICYLLRDLKSCRAMPNTKDKCKICIKEYFRSEVLKNE